MQLSEKVKETQFLGREFLLWLWFMAETERGHFDMGKKGTAELWFDGKLTLQSENERGIETIICAGEATNMREARFALAGNKEVVQAAVKLLIGDNQWSFVLDSTWLNFSSFKTPKVMMDRQDDPDGIFYEKMFLIEEAISAIDVIYSSFIKLRLSPEWTDQERPALVKWISEGKDSAAD